MLSPSSPGSRELPSYVFNAKVVQDGDLSPSLRTAYLNVDIYDFLQHFMEVRYVVTLQRLTVPGNKEHTIYRDNFMKMYLYREGDIVGE